MLLQEYLTSYIYRSNLSSTIDKQQTHSLTSYIRVIQSNRYITSLQHMENALRAMKNVNGKAKKQFVEERGEERNAKSRGL